MHRLAELVEAGLFLRLPFDGAQVTFQHRQDEPVESLAS